LDFTPDISKFVFYPYILRVFGFYSLKFEIIWILYLEVLKFGGVRAFPLAIVIGICRENLA